jgi:DNA-binding transcriptional MerR regulator
LKTLSEVLRDGKISYRTLVKYVEMGILPKPKRVWRGRRGSESLYADDTIDIIPRVRFLQRKGLTLSQIAEQFRQEQAELRTLKPTEEYLIPLETDELADYLVAYQGFHAWLDRQIRQQMPRYEFDSVVIESVTNDKGRFLRPKEIIVRPKEKIKSGADSAAEHGEEQR